MFEMLQRKWLRTDFLLQVPRESLMMTEQEDYAEMMGFDYRDTIEHLLNYLSPFKFNKKFPENCVIF
jgi:hypothetical protein